MSDDKTKVFSAMRARTQENIARQKAEEYTPTTDSIREGYAFTVQSKVAGATFGQGLAEFDRWLAAHDEAVRADMQPREVRTVEYRRVMPDGRPRLGATFEQVPELDEGWTAEFRELGPWHAVTPSTPNQQGAEQ